MYDKESFNPESRTIRDSVIPTSTVRLVELELASDENGIVVSYDPDPVRLEAVNFISISKEILPITMRKYRLYNQSFAS